MSSIEEDGWELAENWGEHTQIPQWELVSDSIIVEETPQRKVSDRSQFEEDMEIGAI